jgi:diguanylate cyclase (GGDEF)-like protein
MPGAGQATDRRRTYPLGVGRGRSLRPSFSLIQNIMTSKDSQHSAAGLQSLRAWLSGDWNRRVPSFIVVGFLLSALMTVLAAAYWLKERQRVHDHAVATASGLHKILAQEADAHLRFTHDFLKALRTRIGTPGFFQQSEEGRTADLFTTAHVDPYISIVAVTDAQGIVIMDSLNNRVKGQNRAWRDYFPYHRDHPDDDLHISGPFQVDAIGETVLALSLRLEDAQGEFSGVLVATIRLKYFEDLMHTVDVGPNGSIAFILNDKILIARKPFDASFLGRDLSSFPIMQQASQAKFHVFLTDAHIDRVNRLYVSGMVGNWPVRINIAQPTDDILTSWREHGLMGGLILLVMLVINLAFALLCLREHRRRQAMQADLEETQTRLSVLAATDPLTGIANRQQFEASFDVEQRRLSRSTRHVSLLVANIDAFKGYNDAYGYEAGDEALQAVARAISGSITRAGDIVARIGGQEFAALLADSDEEGALAAAKRIRAIVESLAIPYAASPHGCITVSVGCATARREEGERTDDLMVRAYDALAKAQQAGRNSVHVDQLASIA